MLNTPRLILITASFVGVMSMNACTKPLPPQSVADLKNDASKAETASEQADKSASALFRAQIKALSEIDNAAALLALAQAYEAHGKNEEAYDAYAAAFRLDPSVFGESFEGAYIVPDAWKLLGKLRSDEAWGNVGDAYVKRGDSDRAVKCYMQALMLDSDDSEWMRKLATLAKEGNKAVERMIPSLSRSAPMAAVGLLIKMERKQQAMEMALAAISRGSDRHLLRAVKQLLDADAGLVDMLTEAAKRSTDDEFVGIYAVALRKAGRNAEACAHFKRAHALDERDSHWRREVRACEEPNPESGSVAVASDGSMPWPGADREQELLNVWRALRAKGGRAKAAVVIREMIKRGRRPSIMLPFLAAVERKKVASVAKELSTGTNNDEIHGQFGDELLRSGNIRAALKAYKRANELDSSDREWKWKRALLEALLSSR